MEKKQSEQASIELLPPKKFEEYTLGKKLTTWIINVGRIIIIGTELLAFSVFVGRIKLDRDLTDLTSDLENQIVILENVAEFEEDFRDLQQQLNVIKTLREGQTRAGDTVSLVSSLLPQDVALTGLTLQPNQPEAGRGESYLMAKTGSATAFARAIQKLKSSSKIREIALTSGRFNAKDSTYHFSLTVKFNDWL